MSRVRNQQQNALNIINSIIPDNRPIKSLQIVEEYEKCPINFTPIYKTYDQDQIADLWKENILFGSRKKTSRFLCLSKTEGLQDYVVEDLKIIGEKELAPEGYSTLTRTADNNDQKAWRKKQLIYKLEKIGDAKQFITDIILCSKFKSSPEGFSLVGEINGILVCCKTDFSTTKTKERVTSLGNISGLTQSIDYININVLNSMVPQNSDDIHYYEVLKPSYKILPTRTAPKPPNTNTLNLYVELDGIQFIINSRLMIKNEMLPEIQSISSDTDYDFNLEREVLCTSKTSNKNMKNPFFHEI